MKGPIRPSMTLYDGNETFVWFKPPPQPKCGEPCNGDAGSMCKQCCWAMIAEQIQLETAWTVATPEEIAEVHQHEHN